MRTASATTDGSALHSASNRRPRPSRSSGASSTATTHADDGRTGGDDGPLTQQGIVAGNRNLGGRSSRQTTAREVGEHHGPRRRPSKLTPPSFALPVEALALERADQHGPAGLGEALVLDRSAGGVHGRLRQHLDGLLGPPAAEPGEDRGIDLIGSGLSSRDRRLQRHARITVALDLADLRDVPGAVSAMAARLPRRDREPVPLLPHAQHFRARPRLGSNGADRQVLLRCRHCPERIGAR